MISFNIVFLIMLIVSFICALNFGGYVFFCTFYVLLLLFIINLLFIIIVKYSVDIDVVINNNIINAGEKVKVTTIVKCGSFIPIPYVTISGSLFGNENIQSKSEIFSMPADENNWIEKEIYFYRRGIYNCGAVNLNIRDTFNITSIRLRKNKDAIIKVYPKVFDIASIVTGGEDIYKNTINIISNKEDQFTIKDVRKYRQGDSLKRVHWKLSAKCGELYVKNSENISGEEVTIFMDMGEKNLSLDEHGEVEENIIDITASVLHYLVNKNIEARVLVNGKHGEEFVISSKEQLNKLLEELLTKNSDGKKDFSHFVYENSYKVSKVNSIILITSEITQTLQDNLLELKGRGYPITLFYSINGISTKNYIEKFTQWGIECYNTCTLIN